MDTEFLKFNPFTLLPVVIWFYLCILSIRIVNNSDYIPKQIKKLTCVICLFLGPLYLLILGFIFLFDLSKRFQSGGMGGLFSRKQKDLPITLLDSSGRESQLTASQDVADLTKKVVFDAISKRASDILIDPKNENEYTVRFRVDGMLQTVREIANDNCVPMVNSIKAISGMDIAEKRRPQDGNFQVKTTTGNVSFRVATAGVYHGEKMALRLLDKSYGLKKLEDVGMDEAYVDIIMEAISRSAGMVIICGPTGSGKTTTFYAMLASLDTAHRNVVTVEDPIEYVLADVSQIEVNVKAGITFSNTLRSILRQDPDVICVGEIRDSETAQMALQSSQTGHLVMATIHSNNTFGTLVRLLDLGVNPRLIAAGLSLVIAQRLVRKLCDNCKQPAELNEEYISYFDQYGLDYSGIMQPVGCIECGNTGYRGRTAVLDILEMSDELKSKFEDQDVTISDLKQQGEEFCPSSLWSEAIKKVLAGETSLEEIERVVTGL